VENGIHLELPEVSIKKIKLHENYTWIGPTFSQENRRLKTRTPVSLFSSGVSIYERQ
jgi:hypothetical protein